MYILKYGVKYYDNVKGNCHAYVIVMDMLCLNMGIHLYKLYMDVCMS